MTAYERRAIDLSVLAALIGVFFAIVLKQGHWFARSGSVVTIVAIYFASLKLQDRVDRAPAVAKVYFERKRQRVSEDLLLISAEN